MLAFIEKWSLTCLDAIRLTERGGLKGVKSTTKLLKKCWKKINSNIKKADIHNTSAIYMPSTVKLYICEQKCMCHL